MKWSPHGSGCDLSTILVWTGPCFFASLKEKALVDAMAACGFLRTLKGKSEVTDLGRTTVLKWELGLCLGLAVSTTDPHAGPGLKAKK